MRILLTLGSTMQPSDSSIIELFDETGESLGSIIKGDGEIWELSVVLLIPRWALGKPISIALNLLLEVGDVGLESLHLLSVDVVSDSNGGGKPVDDQLILVGRGVGGHSEDILYGGGGQWESPRVNGGNGNLRPVLSEVSALEGIVSSEAKMSGETFRGLFRG